MVERRLDFFENRSTKTKEHNNVGHIFLYRVRARVCVYRDTSVFNKNHCLLSRALNRRENPLKICCSRREERRVFNPLRGNELYTHTSRGVHNTIHATTTIPTTVAAAAAAATTATGALFNL